MKKLIVFMLVIVIFSGMSFAGERVSANIELNGEKVLAGDLAPYIEDGVTMVPVRWVAEKLGEEVTWNGDKFIVGINTDVNNNLSTFGRGNADNVTVVINEVPIGAYTDRKSIIIEGTTFVPLRPVANGLNIDIAWDADNKKVILTRETEEKGVNLEDFKSYQKMKDFNIKVGDKLYNLEDIVKDPNLLNETKAKVIEDGDAFGSKAFIIEFFDGVEGPKKTLDESFDHKMLLPEDVRYILGELDDYVCYYEPRAASFGWYYKEK